MKFICDTCKSYLADNPDRQRMFWRSALDKARISIQEQNFDNAITAYGNALEAACMLMPDGDCEKTTLDAYIKTAMEMTYALRRGGYFKDIEPFIGSIAHRLEQVKKEHPVQWYLQPLLDVVSHPICAVDYWLRSSFQPSLVANEFTLQ